MKWNIEWIDLQNIERMIADCWRMSSKQLEQYYKKLSARRDLEFAGTFGIVFLDLMNGIITGKADYDWSKLQKDVHMLQKLIQDGLDRDETFWKEQYYEILDEPSFYFYTALGKAFTDQLAVKLELNVTQEQKLLQQDIQMIEKICKVCDFKKESDIRKALSILNQKDRNYFSSWLGESFVNTIQEQFVKKEEPKPPEPLPLPEPEPNRRRIFHKKEKSAKMQKTIKQMLFCIPIVCIGIWFYSQIRNDRIHFYLQQLHSTVKAITAEKSDKTDQADTSYTANNPVKLSLDSKKNQAYVPDSAVEVPVSEKGTKQEAQSMDEPGQTISDAAEKESENVQQTSPSIPDILPQYRSFHEEYPDLFGWLKIPGTEIDVPVMQSDDEEKGEKYYYLHRDYRGRESAEGSLFVDSRSSCYPQDQNTVIYGHNMSSGQIFGTLDRFTDFDFFREHQNMQYDTIYEEGIYRIAAVLKTRILYQEEEGFRYYRFFNYDTEEEFAECLAFIKENQLFDTMEELKYGDQLLMLSTCEYSQENGRLVVVAKRVNEWS